MNKYGDLVYLQYSVIYQIMWREISYIYFTKNNLKVCFLYELNENNKQWTDKYLHVINRVKLGEALKNIFI